MPSWTSSARDFFQFFHVPAFHVPVFHFCRNISGYEIFATSFTTDGALTPF